jgi:hypothetical protein
MNAFYSGVRRIKFWGEKNTSLDLIQMLKMQEETIQVQKKNI